MVCSGCFGASEMETWKENDEECLRCACVCAAACIHSMLAGVKVCVFYYFVCISFYCTFSWWTDLYSLSLLLELLLVRRIFILLAVCVFFLSCSVALCFACIVVFSQQFREFDLCFSVLRRTTAVAVAQPVWVNICWFHFCFLHSTKTYRSHAPCLCSSSSSSLDFSQYFSRFALCSLISFIFGSPCVWFFFLELCARCFTYVLIFRLFFHTNLWSVWGGDDAGSGLWMDCFWSYNWFEVNETTKGCWTQHAYRPPYIDKTIRSMSCNSLATAGDCLLPHRFATYWKIQIRFDGTHIELPVTGSVSLSLYPTQCHNYKNKLLKFQYFRPSASLSSDFEWTLIFFFSLFFGFVCYKNSFIHTFWKGNRFEKISKKRTGAHSANTERFESFANSILWMHISLDEHRFIF